MPKCVRLVGELGFEFKGVLANLAAYGLLTVDVPDASPTKIGLDLTDTMPDWRSNAVSESLEAVSSPACMDDLPHDLLGILPMSSNTDDADASVGR